MTEKNVVGAQKKEALMPVFNADIMEAEEDLIQPVSSLSGVSGVAPISANVSSVDAIGMWRIFSNRLKKRRLRELANQKSLTAQNIVPQQSIENKFQEDYEEDDMLLSGSNQSGKFLNHMLEKIWFANLNIEPDLLHKIEEEEYMHPDDGIVRVSDVMNKNVICVIESTPIEQVASIFNTKHISGVPVVHYLSKHLLGIISMADILFSVFNEKTLTTFQNEGTFFKQDSLAILEMPVGNFMKKEVVQILPNATIKEACLKMVENDVHRLIVTKNKTVRGILTTTDITGFLARTELKK